MNKYQHYTVAIAGAGGIGRAVGLLMAAYADFDVTIFIGDKEILIADEAAGWINEGCETVKAHSFLLASETETPEMEEVFSCADILLDCLPGHFAPSIGRIAKKYNLHYINLTEHVEETEQLKEIAAGASTGFVLQSGLAPGFINVLACHLYQQFVAIHQTKDVEYIGMKVGALTKHASPPHFYGFTWSPVGVATEYFKDAIVIRDYKKTSVPSLSEDRRVIIDNNTYEEDYTSGGAADLPEAFEGIARRLDYKTLRYPGHYAWVKSVISNLHQHEDSIDRLGQTMLDTIPFVEDDKVVLYAGVLGKNKYGLMQAIEQSLVIEPIRVGKHLLRAIQSTTAAPMAECARMLLKGSYRGVVLQSQIDSATFLDGPFVRPIYFRNNAL